MILIDTREKRPLPLAGPTQPKALKYGDYSVPGLETIVAVEWKSGLDFARCVYSKAQWARLMKQCRRLVEKVEFPLLIVQEPPADGRLHQSLRGLKRDAVVGAAMALVDSGGALETPPTLYVATAHQAARAVEAWLTAPRCHNCRAYQRFCTCGAFKRLT